jgi:glyoxylase-like metal-dependent hydrolase (beta-lactamase superfamily II)
VGVVASFHGPLFPAVGVRAQDESHSAGVVFTELSLSGNGVLRGASKVRMRVHHVDCGTLCPASARLVNGRGGWFERGRIVCHCLIVETSDGLVLVDTGLGTHDVEDPAGRLGGTFLRVTRPRLAREQTALAHVERLGFRRDDVRAIVPTHLDLDHVGGLSDFPAATVHVFAPELRAATERATAGERARYRPLQLAHGPRWAVHEVEGDRWFGFDRVRVIADDVALVPLVGHTRGHCGVAVRGDGGWLLHAGDAYFFHGEVDPRAPRSTPGLALFQRIGAVDDAARRANQSRLRSLVRDHGAEVRVFSAHDPVELDAVSQAPSPSPSRGEVALAP